MKASIVFPANREDEVLTTIKEFIEFGPSMELKIPKDAYDEEGVVEVFVKNVNTPEDESLIKEIEDYYRRDSYVNVYYESDEEDDE
ncbi:hypothetical protein RU639_013020 [Aspergillus parasiticus]